MTLARLPAAMEALGIYDADVNPKGALSVKQCIESFGKVALSDLLSMQRHWPVDGQLGHRLNKAVFFPRDESGLLRSK
jgi:hypothetical protein